MEGKAEKGVNNKRDQGGCSNNGVEVEVVDISRDGLEGIQEIGQGDRHLGERMEVDSATPITDPKRIALQVIDHNRMIGTISAKKGDGIAPQGTWKQFSRGDHSEGRQPGDTEKENNWEEKHKRSRQREEGELSQEMQEKNDRK